MFHYSLLTSTGEAGHSFLKSRVEPAGNGPGEETGLEGRGGG